MYFLVFYMGKIGSDYWICVGFVFFVLFVRLIIVWNIKECNFYKKKIVDDKLIFMIKFMYLNFLWFFFILILIFVCVLFRICYF